MILFGGTFDPIHKGHTAVATFSLKYIGAEKIIFIPAKRSVLKALSPHAADADRLKMIFMAVAGNQNFEVSDYELTKPGASYTIETVKYFQEKFGNDTMLYWLVGADSVNDLPYWYKIIELLDTCELAIMYRDVFAAPDFSKFENTWGIERIQKLQRNIIPTPLVPISSTKIREAIAAGDDVSDMLAPKVADYIRQNCLYQPSRKV